MKKLLNFFSAVVLMSALCAGFMACGDSESDTYVTEYYDIVNEIDSDIVVELPSGEIITIEPGEQYQVQKFDMVYPPGVALLRDMYTVRDAVMTIDGETVSESIWLFQHWDSVRENGGDDHHYSVQYTLTVTDELLENLETPSE